MLLAPLVTPQDLDLLFAVLSLAMFAAYHAWYYSWHWWPSSQMEGPLPACTRIRLDETGQAARIMFTRAVLASASDADNNLAVQTMRNPITAASILGTGASVGVTTLINIVLDKGKMDVVRELSRKDPLTGGSSIIGPEAKLTTAMGALFLSFFALAQALRLFVHFPFIVRASQHCRSVVADMAPAPPGATFTTICLEAEAVSTCLRGQTFFSLGLRFLYLFIPLVMWSLGGTWLLAGTALEVLFLYILDRL